jgi:hypothetical protein
MHRSLDISSLYNRSDPGCWQYDAQSSRATCAIQGAMRYDPAQTRWSSSIIWSPSCSGMPRLISCRRCEWKSPCLAPPTSLIGSLSSHWSAMAAPDCPRLAMILYNIILFFPFVRYEHCDIHEPAQSSAISCLMKRTHDFMDGPQPRARRQDPVSCNFCRLKKLKCNRQSPCSNCVTRKVECIGVQSAVRVPTSEDPVALVSGGPSA